MSYSENKNIGYVWLYRSVSGHYAVDKDNDHFRLWCELLIQAAHKEGRTMMFSGEKIILKKGQLITGRDVLAAKTHIHRSKVERILKLFENEQQIEQLKTAHGRLITVLKLPIYHSFEQQSEQPVSNQRATSEQPVSTNNNGNKGKKDKNTIREEDFDRAKSFLTAWNEIHGTKYRSYEAITQNLKYWLTVYPPQDILQAITNVSIDSFWKDKMSPVTLLRQKNNQGEKVDYIGKLLHAHGNRENIPHAAKMVF